MFGFSFGKLLVLAIVIGVVWFGWRKLADMGQALARQDRGRAPERPPGQNGGDETVDLVRDPVTGRYEPRKPD